MMSKLITTISIAVLMPFLMMTTVWAEESMINKVVIQVSTDDINTQQLALNNAVNLQQLYGIDGVIIEIVAYGPGLSLLTTESPWANRVSSLSLHDITFSACENTIKAQQKRTGKRPILLDGVETVNAGVARIMTLQQQGYAYIKP